MRLSNQTTGGPAMRRPAITGTGHANATDAVPVLRCDGIVARERTYAPRSILEEHVHEYAARPPDFVHLAYSLSVDRRGIIDHSFSRGLTNRA